MRSLLLALLCYGHSWPGDVRATGTATARTPGYARQLAQCAAKDEGQRQCGERDYYADDLTRDQCTTAGSDTTCEETYCGHCVERVQ